MRSWRNTSWPRTTTSTSPTGPPGRASATAERVAIEYAEKFALDHTKLDDAFFRRLHEHFTDEEIMEIAVSVGCWMMMGRITMVMDVNVSCALTLELGAKADA